MDTGTINHATNETDYFPFQEAWGGGGSDGGVGDGRGGGGGKAIL
jgi:hypothetical protein